MLCAGSKPVSNRWPSSSKYELRQYRASMSRGSMISTRTRDAKMSLSASAIAVRHKRGRRNLDFAASDVGRGTTNADRGHDASALTRLRFHFASEPHQDAL